jgi:hypothetical protein
VIDETSEPGTEASVAMEWLLWVLSICHGSWPGFIQPFDAIMIVTGEISFSQASRLEAMDDGVH